MKICILCKVNKPVEEFYKDRTRRDGLDYKCKVCRSKVSKVFHDSRRELKQKKDRLKEKPKNTLYKPSKKSIVEGKQNPEYYREYYLANKEKKKEYYFSYYKNNKSLYTARVHKRKALEARALPKWADLKAISEIYKEREKISKETGILHHVDHIIPLNSKVVCGLHVEYNLRIIPAVDNLRKGNRLDTS